MGVRQHVAVLGRGSLPHVELVCLGAGQRGRCIITCEAPYEVDTHRIGGRTLPCMDSECQACRLQFPGKYEGYVSLIWVVSKKHTLLRLTKPAILQLKSQTTLRSSLRGTPILVERKGNRPNGRVLVQVEEHLIDPAKLPQAPDIPAHMARIWQIGGLDLSHDADEYLAQICNFTQKALEHREAKNAAEA